VGKKVFRVFVNYSKTMLDFSPHDCVAQVRV
jgi:hypothetical protein